MASKELKPKDLVEAARRGDCSMVQYVLEIYPSQVDIQHSGMTALQQAAYHGHTEVMKALLRNGADIHCSDINYCTPLHHAVRGNQPEAVLLLLQNGSKLDETDGDGITAPQAAYTAKFNSCLKVFGEWDDKTEFKMQWDKKEEKQECAGNQYMQSVGHEDVDTNTVGNATEECIDEEPTVKKCIYCQANAATITFEPCNHVISCFECCIHQEICRECGTPIEKRSLCEDSMHLNRYVEGIRAMKGEIKQNQDRISTVTKRFDELQDCITCNICKNLPIMCALSCGHMYCVPCVKRLKDYSPRVPNRQCGYCFSEIDRKKFYGLDPKCAFCSTVSRYTMLLPKFPKKDCS